MTPDEFTVRVTFLSDWHVGTGYGRPGHVDRLTRRDPDGLPCVPAKTIRGMWRDAAERLAAALDDGRPAGPWARFVDDIFGSQPQLAERRNDRNEVVVSDPSGHHNDPANGPRATRLFVESARMPAALRDALRGTHPARRGLRAALTFVKPGVRIEATTGRAMDEHLRFEEFGRVGTVLDAGCRLDLPAEARPAAGHFLTAAAALIERLGGKRRRGAGRCRVEVLGRSVPDAAAWLDANPTPPGVPEPAVAVPAASHSATGDWDVIPLRVTLSAPLAVPARTVGNIVETLDYVPGTMLLPHVTRALAAAGADEPAVRAAVAAEDVCVLNATIEVAGRRGLPVPASYFGAKTWEADHTKPVANQLVRASTGDKPQREGYVAPGRGPDVAWSSVPTAVHTHNVVEDKSQRPTEAVGGVYSYEAIGPTDDGRPRVLRSEVRVRKGLAHDDAAFRERLAGPVRLGSSKKDDYGAATVSVTDPEPAEPARDGSESVDAFTVWLESDVLLRDERLRPQATAAALGLALAARLGDGVTLQPGASFLRVRRTDSWHTGWGLPRPSLVGLQAGSCVAFRVTGGTVTAARLAAVAADGVGERRGEGFGRVRLNDPLLEANALSLRRAHADPSATDGPPPSFVSDDRATREFAELVEREAWKTAIRRAAAAVAAEQRRDVFGWDAAAGSPPMSQLGGLRTAVQFLREPADAARVGSWLDAVAANRRRSAKWPRDAIDKAKRLVADPGHVWAKLAPALERTGLPTLTRRPDEPAANESDADRRLRRELWAYAVRALVDAAVRAHKRETERGEVPHGA